MPDNDNPDNMTDVLTVACVLTYEYYGHRAQLSKYKKEAESGVNTSNTWEDEYNASYLATKNTPNLIKDERRMLIVDVLDRKREANVNVVYDDPEKNKVNIEKHKVGFNEASTIFAGRYIEIPDIEHSDEEDRFVAFGISLLSRELFVCYCYRINVNGETVIRIYSARKATNKEKEEFFNEG